MITDALVTHEFVACDCCLCCIVYKVHIAVPMHMPNIKRLEATVIVYLSCRWWLKMPRIWLPRCFCHRGAEI
jgi:hypothetical protein